MWIVYRQGDPYDCGWEVESREEAIQQCEEDENLTYVYVGQEVM